MEKFKKFCCTFLSILLILSGMPKIVYANGTNSSNDIAVKREKVKQKIGEALSENSGFDKFIGTPYAKESSDVEDRPWYKIADDALRFKGKVDFMSDRGLDNAFETLYYNDRVFNLPIDKSAFAQGDGFYAAKFKFVKLKYVTGGPSNQGIYVKVSDADEQDIKKYFKEYILILREGNTMEIHLDGNEKMQNLKQVGFNYIMGEPVYASYTKGDYNGPDTSVRKSFTVTSLVSGMQAQDLVIRSLQFKDETGQDKATVDPIGIEIDYSTLQKHSDPENYQNDLKTKARDMQSKVENIKGEFQRGSFEYQKCEEIIKSLDEFIENPTTYQGISNIAYPIFEIEAKAKLTKEILNKSAFYDESGISYYRNQNKYTNESLDATVALVKKVKTNSKSMELDALLEAYVKIKNATVLLFRYDTSRLQEKVNEAKQKNGNEFEPISFGKLAEVIQSAEVYIEKCKNYTEPFAETDEYIQKVDKAIRELKPKANVEKVRITLQGSGLEVAPALQDEKVAKGTRVEIKVTSPVGKEVKSFKVNNEEKKDALVENKYSFEANTDTTIAVEYKDKEAEKVQITLQGEGLEVTPVLENGKVNKGTRVQISINVPSNKEINSFKVNEVEKKQEISENVYSFDANENTTIKVEYKNKETQPPINPSQEKEYTVNVRFLNASDTRQLSHADACLHSRAKIVEKDGTKEIILKLVPLKNKFNTVTGLIKAIKYTKNGQDLASDNVEIKKIQLGSAEYEYPSKIKFQIDGTTKEIRLKTESLADINGQVVTHNHNAVLEIDYETIIEGYNANEENVNKKALTDIITIVKWNEFQQSFKETFGAEKLTLFNKIVEEAKKVRDNGASTQTQIDEHYNKILAEKEKLDNATALKVALADAEATYKQAVLENKYTEESLNKIKTRIDEIKTMMSNGVPSNKIEELKNELLNIYKLLRYDTTKLQEAVQKAKAKLSDGENYTQSSKDALEEALKKAKEYIEKAKDTKFISFDEMKTHIQKINELVDKLEPDTPQNPTLEEYKALKKEIEAAKKLENTDVKFAGAFEKLQKAIEKAEKSLKDNKTNAEELKKALAIFKFAIAFFKESEYSDSAIIERKVVEKFADIEQRGTVAFKFATSTDENQISMLDMATVKPAKIFKTSNGYVLNIAFKSHEINGALLANLSIKNEGGSFVLVEPITEYSIKDNYNSENSEDDIMRGKKYPKEYLIPINENQNKLPISIYIPAMAGSRNAMLVIDWDSSTLGSLDKQVLINKIRQAKNIQIGNKTDEAFGALQEAIEKAQGKLNEIATQEQLQSVLNELENAIQTFNNSQDKIMPIDKQALLNKIVEAKTINRNEYEAESLENLDRVITKAQSMYSNSSSSQEDINAMITELSEVINKLVKKEVEKVYNVNAKLLPLLMNSKPATAIGNLINNVKVTQKGEKYIYEIEFKPVAVEEKMLNVMELFDANSNSKANLVEKADDFVKFNFERNANDEALIDLEIVFGANQEESSKEKFLLVIDWDTKKLIENPQQPKEKFTITLEGENITLRPNMRELEKGTSVVAVVNPPAQHKVKIFTVNGVDKKAELVGNIYTFIVNENSVIKVEYEKIANSGSGSGGSSGGSTGGGSSSSGSSGGSGGSSGGGAPSPAKTTEVPKNVDVKKVDQANNVSEIFSDLVKGAWYEKGIGFVISKNLMVGDGSRFMPNAKLSKNMVITVLHRFSNPSEIKDTQGKWYEAGVSWATQNNILTQAEYGKISDIITREQMVKIIYNYAKFAKLNMTAGDSLSKFKDTDKLSPDTILAMNWAIENGIVSGTSQNTLSPKDNLTRAQLAVIIQNFAEKFSK